MIKALDLNSNKVMYVEPVKWYGTIVHNEAVYQYTSNYNNHIVLLIQGSDNDVEVNGVSYSKLWTNDEDYFIANFEHRPIMEQLVLDI